MTRTTVSIHVGTWPDRPHQGEPRDGARIELHTPNGGHHVIAIEHRACEWIALHDLGDGVAPCPGRPTFADAFDDAMALVAREVQAWH